METAVNLQLLHLVFLHDPLTAGAPAGVTLLHAGGVGVASSSDDMLGVVRASGDVRDIAFQLAPSQELASSFTRAPSAPTKRVDLGGTAKIYAGETSIWAAGAGKGGAGGDAARWRGERGGGGAEAQGLAGWLRFAHMGGATKHRAARGRKNQKQNLP